MSDVVPIGWERVTLGEIVQPTRPRVEPSDHLSLRYVGLEHVASESMTLIETQPAREISSTCTKFEVGDVLYARMRPNLNKVWVADRDGLCSTEFIVLPRSPDLDSHFLGFRLNTLDFVGFAVQQVAGDRPRVSFEQIATFEFLLPPLAEQKRIVEELRSQLAKAQRGVEKLRHAKQKLLDYRNSVMVAAVTGRLRIKHKNSSKKDATEESSELAARLAAARAAKIRGTRGKKGKTTETLFPDGDVPASIEPDLLNVPQKPEAWAWVSVDQIAWDSGYGTSTRCTSDGKGPPVLRIPNVKDGRITWDDIKYAVDTGALHDGDWIAAGDLLVIRTNGSRDLVGRAATIEEAPVKPTGFASYLIRFRLLGDPTLWRWICLAWNSPAFRPLLECMASTTAGQFNLSVSTLRSFALPLPPSDVQATILGEVEVRLHSSDRLRERIERQIDRARDQRRSFVQEAFSGRFVDQIPTEEPASVLMERLRAGLQIATRLLREVKLRQKEKRKVKPVRKSLLETLTKHGEPMSPEALFEEAGFAAAFRKANFDQAVVDEFYDELRGLMLTTPGIRSKRPDANTILLERAS